jgi:hypothetical protein
VVQPHIYMPSLVCATASLATGGPQHLVVYPRNWLPSDRRIHTTITSHTNTHTHSPHLRPRRTSTIYTSHSLLSSMSWSRDSTTPMDFEYQNHSGPIDQNSPFIKAIPQQPGKKRKLNSRELASYCKRRKTPAEFRASVWPSRFPHCARITLEEQLLHTEPPAAPRATLGTIPLFAAEQAPPLHSFARLKQLDTAHTTKRY